VLITTESISSSSVRPYLTWLLPFLAVLKKTVNELVSILAAITGFKISGAPSSTISRMNLGRI
jgi:hypothetical protein